MTTLQINGSDTTTLHLFHLDLPPEAVERFTRSAGTGEWPLKYTLGAETLRESFVDVVAINDLGGMPLSQYLAEAYDVPPRRLGSDAARIDALEGHAIVLPPQAFEGVSQTLTVAPPLELIGSYGEVKPTAQGAKLAAESAHGSSGGGAPVGQSRGNSRLLKLILAVVAVILVVVIWMALA